jgi:lipopolysaccharide biosynthesis protein/predicted  nucleic acid-binding Zn-ribbon protein
MQQFGTWKTQGASDNDVERHVLAPMFRRSMLWTPERRAVSHWIEHVPFAFWLVDVLRPHRIVELGTYNGVSYSAMCQAVKSLGLSTACFAVDTWKGEEYMGFYREDVYREFAAFHDRSYGAFSQLVRSTFDEAQPHFEDGSIDLLHIDGVHTYEAVRHDYRSWLPKLSANAVVLFHDTNVREREFGVFRLWSEITGEKPHFDFLHGYGLGILGEGRGYSGALGNLFSANKDDRLASSIREMFAALGRSLRASCERPGLDQPLLESTSEAGKLRNRLAACEDELTLLKQGLAESSAEIGRLRDTLAARDNALTSSRQEVSKSTAEIDTLRETLAARDNAFTLSRQEVSKSTAEVDTLRETLAARDNAFALSRQEVSKSTAEIDTLRETLAAREKALTLSKQGLSKSRAEIDALRETVAARENEVRSMASSLSALHVSTSWRLTAPLRAVRRLSATLRYSGLIYPLALGWTAIKTLSLAPLRDWRAERLIARSGLFDKDSYMRNNPDVAEWRINPVRHYVVFGAKECRDPSPSFSTRAYLLHNPDVAAAKVNPLAHFIKYGSSERRLAYPPPNAAVRDHRLPSSSKRPYGVTDPWSDFVDLRIKPRLKQVLGPKISARLARVFATTRFGVRKLAILQQGAKRGESFLEIHKEAYLTHAQHAISPHSPHYGARLAKAPPTERCDVHLVAYYLPQYHPIPENDRWWGPGFTEWRNVARAFPTFAGHDQPRLPGELGYYDLRIPETMQRQIELAKLHGISAFCFHFYWFGGTRPLELPIANFLRNSNLDFKFCLCWANENWTRRWDGADQELLIAQSHSPEDDVALIRYLTKYFLDPRYLRIDGRPVLTVYRPGILPDAKATAERWRTEVERAGLPGIYLVATNSFGFTQYETVGFDALSEFPPHGINVRRDNEVELLHSDYQGCVYSYAAMLNAIKRITRAEDVSTHRVVFPGVMPSWDNTPRQPLKGHVFHGSTPNLFYEWLVYSIARARRNRAEERLVFINAWNEWAESAYLEPDRKYGYAYLAACAAAISDNASADARVADLFKRQRDNFKVSHRRAIAIHLYYEDLAKWFAEKVADFGEADVYITVPRAISYEKARAVTEHFGSAYILEVDNRGRDVRPFLALYAHFLKGGYDFVCKLHSKKSTHLHGGDRWRIDMVGQLLGPAAKEALDTYQAKSSIGILAARGSLESLADPNIRLRSENNLNALARRLNYEINFKESFVAGSMFWFRPSALQNVYELFAQGLEFEPELGQVDGTMAHALERIVCIAAKAVGMSTREFGETISRPSEWV